MRQNRTRAQRPPRQGDVQTARDPARDPVSGLLLLGALLLLLLAALPVAASSVPTGLRFTVDPAAQGQSSASLAGEVNEMRRQQGLPLLRSLSELDRIAAARAADMARNGYFSHYDGRGETVVKRVRESGLSACRTSETIAFGQDTPRQTAIEWMRSPGHRTAMLDTRVDHIGTARAVAQGRAYWVAVFARLC